MLKRKEKKISMILLVVMMLTMIFPVSAGAATGKKFSDVPGNHWAKQQISRMNYRGIVMGYEDGTMKPENAVTEFEAIVMAARLLGLTDKTDSVAKDAVLPVKVPTWSGAREVAVVAYQAGLIDEKDFKQDQSATREWIAKLLVKVLGKEGSVEGAAGEYLAFTDTNKIGSGYLNYVKVANSLNLISGYADGSFKPQNKVSRSEMAAFLARAEDQMSVSANNLLLGSITAISGINLEITGTDGVKKNLYVIPNDSALYDINNKSIAVADLAVGNSVYALYEDTLLNYLEVRDGKTQTPTVTPPIVANVEGTVTKIVADKHTIVVTAADATLSTIVINDSTKITNEGSANILAFSDISVNDTVKIVSSNQIASQVVIGGKGTNYTQGGTIYDVDVYNRLIIMQQTEGLKTYKMATNMNVSIAGMLTATASNLKVGDKASFEIENNEMTAIAVAGNSALYDGTVTVMEINTFSKFLTYKTANGELKANYYDSNTSITFDGERGKITDLQTNDVAKISTSGNKITNISVENRKLSEGYKGTVYAVDTTNSILTFRDGDGNLKTYPVANNASISVYESSSYLSAVKKDMVIEVGITNGAITMIKANNRVTGTVVAVNSNNNYLEIQPDNAKITTVYDVSNDVIIYEKDTASYRLKNISVGDEVSIKIENNKVTQIDLATKIDYIVTDTYGSSSTTVEVQEVSNNKSRDLYISSDVTLVVPGVTNPRVRDLQINDKLIATYLGNTLTKVEATSKAAGTVTGINPSTKLVTITGYDGKSYKYNFDSASYVTDNGYTYSDLSRLKINDKVLVIEGADKGRNFALLQTKTAKVGSMQDSTKLLFMQNSSSVGDWTSYNLDKNVYLHQGSTRLAIKDFKIDNTVTIYYNEKVVYEVEKK